MKKDKIIFIDYDGTFYDHSIDGVHPSTIKILADIQTHQLADVFLSTGRTMTFLKYHPSYQHLFNGFITANGQYVVYNQHLIIEEYLDIHQVIKLIEYCRSNHLSMALFTKNYVYINFFNELLTQDFITNNPFPVDFIENIQVKDLKIYQICLFTNNENLDLVKKEFPLLQVLKWGNHSADVISAQCSKGQAIKKVLFSLPFDNYQTYAIGDGENDLSMFQAVDVSIAMGNASETIKRQASYVTEDKKDDGLAKALLKIINNQI